MKGETRCCVLDCIEMIERIFQIDVGFENPHFVNALYSLVWKRKHKQMRYLSNVNRVSVTFKKSNACDSRNHQEFCFVCNAELCFGGFEWQVESWNFPLSSAGKTLSCNHFIWFWWKRGPEIDSKYLQIDWRHSTVCYN